MRSVFVLSLNIFLFCYCTAGDPWDDILSSSEIDTTNWRDPNDMGQFEVVQSVKTNPVILKSNKNVDALDPMSGEHLQSDKHEEKAEDRVKGQSVEEGESVSKVTTESKPGPISPLVKIEDIDVKLSESSSASSLESTFTLHRVNRLLSLMGVEKKVDYNDEVEFTYHAFLKLNGAQLKKLIKFVDRRSEILSRKEEVGLLHDVNALLNECLVDVRPARDDGDDDDDVLPIFSNFPAIFLNGRGIFWATLIVAALGFFILIQKGLSVGKLVFIILIVSYLWTWVYLYHKEVSHQQVTLMAPQECHKERPWYSQWKSFIFGSDQRKQCYEFHEALWIDPLWKVSPTLVLAEMATQFVTQPMEKVGENLGKFFNGITSQSSWLTVIPVLAFVFAVIFMLILMACNYRIRLPFLLASIEPEVASKPPSQPPAKFLLQDERIEQLQMCINRLDNSFSEVISRRSPKKAITCSQLQAQEQPSSHVMDEAASESSDNEATKRKQKSRNIEDIDFVLEKLQRLELKLELKLAEISQEGQKECVISQSSSLDRQEEISEKSESSEDSCSLLELFPTRMDEIKSPEEFEWVEPSGDSGEVSNET